MPNCEIVKISPIGKKKKTCLKCKKVLNLQDMVKFKVPISWGVMDDFVYICEKTHQCRMCADNLAKMRGVERV